MELTFDDRKMQFYPQYEELEELALFVVTLICKTMQSVPTVSMIRDQHTLNIHTHAHICRQIDIQIHVDMMRQNRGHSCF